MSKTVDFINSSIEKLNSTKNAYQQDIDEATRNINAANAAIADLDSQIDEYNVELQKIQITDDQLTTIKSTGVIDAKHATIL
jgi:prefoldin subunit 5